MKIAFLFAAALPLFAADIQPGDLDHFLDIKANYTQRNTACLALRGSNQPEVIAAMRAALENPSLQACAGANLRVAGAAAELLNALTSPDASTRAVAARELGAMQKPEFLIPLRKAVEDKDLLVASNAIEGLVRYEDHSSASALREVALMGGVLTTLAMDTLIDWHDPEVLAIGRRLIAREAPGDQLAGIRAIGLTGDASDLPKLRELSKDDTALASGGRGFGFMPAVSIARAAKTAIQHIEQRASN
jgi:HEAT repeat protein